MNAEYFKISNKMTLIIMAILITIIGLNLSQVRAETQSNSMMPIFGHTNNSFLYKFQVEDRTCVLAEDQYGKAGRSLVCWPTTQK